MPFSVTRVVPGAICCPPLIAKRSPVADSDHALPTTILTVAAPSSAQTLMQKNHRDE